MVKHVDIRNEDGTRKHEPGKVFTAEADGLKPKPAPTPRFQTTEAEGKTVKAPKGGEK
jgi:hypothetical protein